MWPKNIYIKKVLKMLRKMKRAQQNRDKDRQKTDKKEPSQKLSTAVVWIIGRVYVKWLKSILASPVFFT